MNLIKIKVDKELIGTLCQEMPETYPDDFTLCLKGMEGALISSFDRNLEILKGQYGKFTLIANGKEMDVNSGIKD